jgi:hypothetical protein
MAAESEDFSGNYGSHFIDYPKCLELSTQSSDFQYFLRAKRHGSTMGLVNNNRKSVLNLNHFFHP